jgi:hypothetical protein
MMARVRKLEIRKKSTLDHLEIYKDWHSSVLPLFLVTFSLNQALVVAVSIFSLSYVNCSNFDYLHVWILLSCVKFESDSYNLIFDVF